MLDSYARLSKNPSTGELEKIETQWADNRRTIDRLGGVLGKELKDGLSAWRKDVRRPDWETLLERVRSGVSDGIVVWHTDRLFRQPRDLETLIDLADKGFMVASAHGARTLSDPDDRYFLRIEVAHAARSSDDTQRRIKRRLATQREDGLPHRGARRFGFPGRDRTWTPAEDEKDDDRPEVSAELIAAEQQALRDGTADVLAGLSSRVAADRWNEDGIRTATGGLWTPSTARAVLLRPINAGRIVHDGVQVGTMPGEPIVDPGEFDRLEALFSSRRRGRRPGAVYAGSGVLRCGVCGHKISGRPHTGTYHDGQKRRQYMCNRGTGGCGKVAADMRAIDEQLRGLVTRRLSDSRYAQAVAAAQAQVSQRLSELDAEIAECEELQQALSDRLGRREITLKAFDAANTPLGASLAALRTERESLTGSPTAAGPVRALPPETIAAQWDDADIPAKRAMLVQALGPLRLLLDPARKDGKRRFTSDRLRLDNPHAPAKDSSRTA